MICCSIYFLKVFQYIGAERKTSPTGQRCVLTVSLRVLSLAIDMSDVLRDRYKDEQTDNATSKHIKAVRGFSLCSSKKRGVKRASSLKSIKLGLKMCALPWGTLIQGRHIHFQVRVRMSQKNVPKMAVFGVFWPKTHLKLGGEP